MPTYEYRCRHCRHRFTVLTHTYMPPASPTCPHCGAGETQRLISRVSIIRSEESRLDDLDDLSRDLADVDESDPRSIARWARKLSKELGEDAGPEFNEIVDRLEAGESPESIEQSLGGENEATGSMEEE